MRDIARATWRQQPWKNGGGTTQEIWRIDDALITGEEFAFRGSYLVRVALATVEHDGPFSQFPGYRRHTFLVGPAPIVLADAELVTAGDHVELPGERTISATLRAGATTLLNVLVRTDASHVVGHGPTAHPVRFVFDLATQTARAADEPVRVDTHGCVWVA